jgi:ketosteroid isomerase-like protein
MSRENVAVIRKGIEAWNSGDMDGVREMYDPGAIVRAPADVPEAGPHVGREAVMRWFGQLREALDSDRLEVLGPVLAQGDRVVVRFAWKGLGRGPEMNLEMTIVYTLRRGRVLEQEYFWDHEEALEAGGLRE